MDAFFCITLSILVLRYWWKHHPPKASKPEPPQEFDLDKLKKVESYTIERRKREEANKQREKDVAELRKQGYTDELIATILPTINNGI